MIRNPEYLKKLQERIAICEKDIENGVNVEIREEQLVHNVDTLLRTKHIERTVKTWERANGKWFNGTANDVASFRDLKFHCQESLYGEKPLDLIVDGLYVPISGSAVEPWDLRHYMFLPASLVEEDEDIAEIKAAFDGWGDAIQ